MNEQNETKEINRLRKALGMPLIKLNGVKRECLRCGQKFKSAGKQNRMCEECKKME